MTNLLVFTTPLPPSTNDVYGKRKPGARSKSGKYLPPMFMKKKGMQFKETVAAIAGSAAAQQGWAYAKGALLAIEVLIYFPDNRCSDVDNRVKLLYDAIAKKLGFNDRKLVDQRARRMPNDKANPRCEVAIRIIRGGQPALPMEGEK